MPAVLITITGTFTRPDGTAVGGRVTFTAKSSEEVNSGTIQESLPLQVAINPSDGTIEQDLAANVGGYSVVVEVTGANARSFDIPGTGNLDLADAVTFEATNLDQFQIVPSLLCEVGTFTPTLTNINRINEFTADTTITIPDTDTMAFPDDTQMAFVVFGGGALTIAAAVGVTLIAPFGLVSNGDGAEVWVRKRKQSVAPDTWVVQL